MYYIITTRGGRGSGGENRIIAMGHRLDYQEGNGYPRLIDENVAFPVETVLVNGLVPDPQNIPDPIEVPDEVMPEEYCYTVEKGFYKNSEYKPPVAETAEATEEAAE